MTILRNFRNLAVVVILTLASLSLSPRPLAAQSSCQPVGGVCNSPGRNAQCCGFHYCSPHRRCCVPLNHQACTSNTQCCSGICLPNGACY
jgi:hypothetical protein